MKSSHIFPRLQVLILLAVLVIGGLYLLTERTGTSLTEFFDDPYHTIRIGDIPVRVEVVNTPEGREHGLSGRESLSETNGLLFVFDRSDYHGIWMEDMNFSIDVIWISENFEVVDIARNITPGTYPDVFEPERPARYVVETNALFVDTFGVAVGDEVYIPEAALK